MTTRLEELEWLHDCTVHGFHYETPESGIRTAQLRMTCPPDLGYQPWNGKTISVRFLDVASMWVEAWAVVGGVETLDAIRVGISESRQTSLKGAQRTGVRFGAVELTIVCHSGSWIELTCKDVEVAVET